MTNINNASNAYLNTVKQLQGGDGPSVASGADGVSFGDVLKQSIQSAIDTQHTSEKMSAAGIMGQANMTDVIQAVNSAELALNTVLAIRDKVVQAYEQIMRTQV